MSDPFETLRADLRRHGKAALAAQAAAERCADLLEERLPTSATQAEDRVAEELIPILDGVERLRRQAERDTKSRWPWRRSTSSVAEGLRIVEAQLLDLIGGRGVEVERPLEGGRFDPSRHRAVATRPGRAETIVEVVRPGYRQGDRLVREADVVVGVRKE